MPGWLVEAVRALARAQAQRMTGYFRHFHDISEDDQVQVGVMGVLRALPSYDTRRGPIAAADGAGGADRVSKPFSTFATLVIKRRLIELQRGRTRRARQDAAIAIACDATVDPETGEPAELADEELATWLRTLRAAAERRDAVDRRRQGRRSFTAAQEVACAGLMWRRGLSCRAAAAELADRPELRTAIGLRSVPHFTWLARVAAEVATRFPDKPPAANNGQKKSPTASVGELVEFHRRSAMHNLAQGAMRDLPVLLTYAMLRDRVIPLSVSTIDKLVKDGRFPAPCRKVGRVKMWARADVEAWLRDAPKAAKKRRAGANN